MTYWRLLGSITSRLAPIAGSAGSIESIPSAVSDISAAISVTNSTKPIGGSFFAEGGMVAMSRRVMPADVAQVTPHI
jgi:hypothetical protein